MYVLLLKMARERKIEPAHLPLRLLLVVQDATAAQAAAGFLLSVGASLSLAGKRF